MRTTLHYIDYMPHMTPTGAAQVPNRVIMHRHGGRVGGERSVPTLNYLNNAGLGIHEDIDLNGDVYHAADWGQTAKHCLEASVVHSMGLRTTGPLGSRGDYDAIGIECVDINVDGVRRLAQETRISAVLRVADICRHYGWDPLGRVGIGGYIIDEHATYDPVNRSEDLGPALNMPDLREDVADVLAGRVPWRTVGPTATGGRAPQSWKDIPVAEFEIHLIQVGGSGLTGGPPVVRDGFTVREYDFGALGKVEVQVKEK